METRWIQRFDNFKSALQQLSSASDLSEARALSDLEKLGVIQAFEFTHELAWNLMKDFLTYQGNGNIMGSREATRKAFKNNILEDGDVWMEMIRSRNLTSHTYNKKVADAIVTDVFAQYLPAFSEFAKKMESLLP